MRLALLDGYRIAVERDGEFYDVSRAIDRIDAIPGDRRMSTVIARFSALEDRFEELANSADAERVPRPRFLPPVGRPSKVLCARGNYREGSDRDPWPLDMFLKSPDSLIGHGGTVRLPPRPHRVFHHEAELGLVMRGTEMGDSSANGDAVFGYTCFIDVSARGAIGRPDGASFIGKSYDTFGPIGPLVVTADEVLDPQNLRVLLLVNGEIWHDYRTSDMEHPIDELVSFAASIMTLNPGDVIACGTNHQGVGPLQNGDRVELRIDHVGALRVEVVDDLGRTWPREVDKEIAARVRRSLPNSSHTEEGRAHGT